MFLLKLPSKPWSYLKVELIIIKVNKFFILSSLQVVVLCLLYNNKQLDTVNAVRTQPEDQQFLNRH